MAESEENIAKVQVRVLHQDMIATLMVPGVCQNIEATDLFRVLEAHKIVFGIEHKEIEKHVQDRQFDKEFVAAVGTHPVIGQDASIVFFFDTHPKKLEPKRREDGSVDQHELVIFPHVEPQTLLARKTPATVAKGSGFTVYGKELPSRDGKDMILKAGANVHRSESGYEYYASVGGAPKLINDTVFIETLFLVEGDVNISTGNIHYQGDVRIKGNVSSHFNVEATGNIVIEGSIEAAQVIAGGSITGLHGIIGGAQGLLKAGTDIHLAFAEGAHLEAKGSVYVNRLIRQCTVIAGHSIFCDREDGLIAGGHLQAKYLIQAKVVGTPLEIKTHLKIGNRPELESRLKLLQEKLQALLDEIQHGQQQIKKLAQTIQRLRSDPDHSGQQLQKALTDFKGIRNLLAQADMDREKINLEKDETEMVLSDKRPPRLSVSKDIYPGVEVWLDHEFLAVKYIMTGNTVTTSDGELKVMGYMHTSLG